MSDYTKITDYAAKDALTTGDPLKLIKGTEIGADFDAVATAIATKADTNAAETFADNLTVQTTSTEAYFVAKNTANSAGVFFGVAAGGTALAIDQSTTRDFCFGTYNASNTFGTTYIYNRGFSVVSINSITSATDSLSIIAGTASNPVRITAGATLRVGAGGTGSIDFVTNSSFSKQVSITNTASANRYITLTGSNNSNPTIGTSAGSLNLSAATIAAAGLTVSGADLTSRGLTDSATATALTLSGSGANSIAIANSASTPTISATGGAAIGVLSPINIKTATAIPVGGAATMAIAFSSSFIGVFVGSGAPSVSAAKGSLYLRSDGSTTNDRMYINTDGSTTWTAVTTAA